MTSSRPLSLCMVPAWTRRVDRSMFRINECGFSGLRRVVSCPVIYDHHCLPSRSIWQIKMCVSSTLLQSKGSACSRSWIPKETHRLCRNPLGVRAPPLPSPFGPVQQARMCWKLWPCENFTTSHIRGQMNLSKDSTVLARRGLSSAPSVDQRYGPESPAASSSSHAFETALPLRRTDWSGGHQCHHLVEHRKACT